MSSPSQRNAATASTRPLATPTTGLAVTRSAATIWLPVRFGFRDSSRPATPATTAGVNEVPQIVPGGVATSSTIWQPGAVRLTHGPRLDQK